MSTLASRRLVIEGTPKLITEIRVLPPRPGRVARLLGIAPKRVAPFPVDPPFLPPAPGVYRAELDLATHTASIHSASEEAPQ